MKTLNIIQIGDTLHVFDDAGRPIVERRVRAGLARGETVIRDGARSWIQTSARINPGQSGSDVYTWDAAGERVAHDRTLVQVDANGTRTETTLKAVFRAP